MRSIKYENGEIHFGSFGTAITYSLVVLSYVGLLSAIIYGGINSSQSTICPNRTSRSDNFLMGRELSDLLSNSHYRLNSSYRSHNSRGHR